MEKELFSNFTYQATDIYKENFYTVEVNFVYRDKPILYVTCFNREDVKADQVVDLTKKEIEEKIKNKKLKKYARWYLDFSHQRAIPKAVRIPLITLGSIVGVFGLLLAGINSFKYLIWKDYYSLRVDIAHNPGLNDGAVPQGLTVSQEEDLILTSAYMKDMKSPSRIYHIKNKKEVGYTELLYDNGTPFTGHVGGLTLVNSTKTLYVSNIEYDVYALKLEDVLNNKTVKVGEPIKTGDTTFGNAGDYIFSSLDKDEKYIYVGEFHNGNQYDRKNEIKSKNGVVHHAAVYRYDRETFSNNSKPNLIYSVPDKVQGFVITTEGRIMLSTSWGLASSHYYVYEPDLIKGAEKIKYENIDTIILDKCSRDIKGPPMAEDLAYKENLLYNMNESASNKYIFGKFLFDAGEIIGLKL